MRIFTPIAVSAAILLSAAPDIRAGQSHAAASQEATCAITGRVTIENEGASGVVITLQPATGRFSMRHLAPWRYYLLARPASDAESSEAQPPPAAWSAESRAKLRREAMASKVEIELQACQRVMDYVLGYEPR